MTALAGVRSSGGVDQERSNLKRETGSSTGERAREIAESVGGVGMDQLKSLPLSTNGLFG